MLMEPFLDDTLLALKEDHKPEVHLLVKRSTERLGLELAEDVIVGFILDDKHGKRVEWVSLLQMR
jgi:hypothetical protein